MLPRSTIRLSCALLAAVALVGCDDDGPSGNDEPGLEVTPLFAAVLETDTLRLSAAFSGQPVSVTWDAQHDTVATVSADGLVTAVSGGFTAVTATQANPQRTRSASITVTPITALTSGATPLAISTTAAAGSRTYRKIVVPAGSTALTVTITADATTAGNVNLYVRRGRIPTTANFDCVSQAAGNNETCTIANPAAGTYYIMAHSTAPYSGARLQATITPTP